MADPTPTERLQLIYQALGDLTDALTAQRRATVTRSDSLYMSPQLEATIARVGLVAVQVGLLQAEGDLYAKGFNAALDAAQNMAKNVAYMKAWEFALLLDHIRKAT